MSASTTSPVGRSRTWASVTSLTGSSTTSRIASSAAGNEGAPAGRCSSPGHDLVGLASACVGGVRAGPPSEPSAGSIVERRHGAVLCQVRRHSLDPFPLRRSRTSTTCSGTATASSCSRGPRGLVDLAHEGLSPASWARRSGHQVGVAHGVVQLAGVGDVDGTRSTSSGWALRLAGSSGVGLVELVGHDEVAGVRPDPPHVQLPQRVELVEGHRRVAVELEQAEEPRDHVRVSVQSAVSARKVVTRTRRSRSTSQAACSRTLTRGACRWSSMTTGVGRGVITRCASAANSTGPRPSSTSGSRPA